MWSAVKLVPIPLRFTPRKKCQSSAMKFEVPKRHTLRPTLSTNTLRRVLRWERQEVLFRKRRVGAHGRKIVVIINFEWNKYWGREDEDKRNYEKTRWWFFLLFLNCPFWAYMPMVTNKIYNSTVSLIMKMTIDPSMPLLFNIRTFKLVMVEFFKIRVQTIPKQRLKPFIVTGDGVLYLYFIVGLYLFIILRKSTLSLLGAWSFLLVRIQFTPSEGPKDFVDNLKRNETRPWKLDHEKKPFSMVRLHGPWCKPALSVKKTLD